MKIIGLIGKKKSGKTTVANYIVKLLHPRNVAIIGFADALKREIAYCLLELENPEAMQAIDSKDTEEAVVNKIKWMEEHKDNFRLILQGWGTDFRRKLSNENYWVDKVESSILVEETNGVEVIVIPDVRFNNEAEMIKKQGGLLIQIGRNTDNVDTHQSETEMDTIKHDFFINNSGDLNDFKFSVRNLLRDSLNLYA